MYTFLKSSHQAGSNHMKKPYCVFLPLIRGFAPECLTSKRVLDPNCVAALNRTGRLPNRFYLQNQVKTSSRPSRPITVQSPPPGVNATATWRIGESLDMFATRCNRKGGFGWHLQLLHGFTSPHGILEPWTRCRITVSILGRDGVLK